MPILPLTFGPWLPDLPQVDLNGLVTAHNVVSDHGGYGPLAGAMVYADTTLSGRPLGATAGQDRHGNAMVFAGCSTKLARIREFPVRVNRASIGTYYDASGFLRTAQPNEVRFDHDPLTGAPVGAMHEASAANLVLQSGDILTTPWSVAGTTTNRTQGDPAFFGQSFTRLAKTTSAAGDVRHAFTNIALNRRAIFSAFVKRGAAGSKANFQCHWTGGAGTQAMGVSFDFDTELATPVQSSTASVGVQKMANGIYRIWCEGAPDRNQTHANFLLAQGQPANTDFQIWGVQYEYGSGVPTSYIPTTNVTVTRATETVIAAGLHWDDISRPQKYLTTDGERWRFASYGNLQIATNYSDPVQAMDKNDDTTFRNLSDEVRGRFVMALDNFVVVGNTRDDYDGDVPIRVRWSGIGDPGYWAVNPTGEFDRTKMSDHQDISGYGNITGLVGGEDGIVLLQKGIVRMTFVGGASIFQFKPVVEGKGCSVPNSVVTVEGRTFFLDDDGFYMYAAGQVAGIGDGKVNDYFKRNANAFYHDRMSVECDPTRSLVYWLYASNASSEGVPDRLIIYNYATNNWSEGEATPAVMLFRSLSLPETIESLDRYETIEMVPASFDSPLFAGGRTQLAGLDRQGRLLTLEGPARPATLRLGEIAIADPIRAASGPTAPNSTRALTRRTRPMLHADNSTTVSTSIRHRNTLLDTQEETAPSHLYRGETFHRTDARYQQIVVRTTGEFEKLIGIEWDAVLTGRS